MKKACNLGTLITIQSGFAFKSRQYTDEGYFLVRIGNVQDGVLSLDNPRYVALDSKTKRFALNAGDLLTSLTGNIGRVARVEKSHLPAALNQRVARLTVNDSSTLSRDYLFYFLTSDWFKDELSAVGHGAAQQNVSPAAIGKLSSPLPPLPEQTRIVAILDEAFAAIATAAANAEKNLANARELFESELNRVFSQKGDGWVEITLAEMSHDFGRGKSKHRPRNADFLYGGKYPFVQTGDIRNSEHIISDYTQTYNEAGLSQSKLWPEGTICITIAATIAETGILGFDACFPDSVVGMVPDPDRSDSGYVEYLLQFFKTELQRQGKGSAQDNINLGTFKRQKFPFASLPEQQAIAAKLDALSKETKNLKSIYQQELTALAELKQSILHKAFTGELTADTKVADRTLSEARV